MEKYLLWQLAGGLSYFKPGFGTAVGEATCPPTVAECAIIQSFGLLSRFFRKGAPFNIIRDRSRRELRMDSGVRGTQHASRRGTPWGMKPVDNVPASTSHTVDDWATPVAYADEKEPVEAS